MRMPYQKVTGNHYRPHRVPDVVDDGSIFGAVAEHIGQAPTQD
jgi:hypothetical protein